MSQRCKRLRAPRDTDHRVEIELLRRVRGTVAAAPRSFASRSRRRLERAPPARKPAPLWRQLLARPYRRHAENVPNERSWIQHRKPHTQSAQVLPSSARRTSASVSSRLVAGSAICDTRRAHRDPPGSDVNRSTRIPRGCSFDAKGKRASARRVSPRALRVYVIRWCERPRAEDVRAPRFRAGGRDLWPLRR